MTYLCATDSDGLVAILHQTIIARASGTTVTLRTGGYRTQATLRALNDAGRKALAEGLPGFEVRGFKGKWTVVFEGESYPWPAPEAQEEDCIYLGNPLS